MKKCTVWDRIHDFADYYQIPVHSLQKTVARFNALGDRQLDKNFNKPILAAALPLQHPPYFGIRLWSKVPHTMGGVLINARAQVLNLSLQPIKGFYAAGEVTGGIHGACRLGTCAIMDCLVFGRIAGRGLRTDS